MSVVRPVVNSVVRPVVRNVYKDELPFPATLNPLLYLSRRYSEFDVSESGGDEYVNSWNDYANDYDAKQTTGDYRPLLKADGVLFDGTNDYVESPFSVINSYPISISCFFKTSTISNDIFIDLADNSYTGTNVLVMLLDNKLSFAIRDVSGAFDGRITSSFDVNDGEWHHFTVTAQDGNSSNWALTIDGVEDTGADNIGSETFPTTLNTFSLGRAGDSTPSNYFNGLLDEVMIFDRPLTKSEIQELYNYGKNVLKK